MYARNHSSFRFDRKMQVIQSNSCFSPCKTLWHWHSWHLYVRKLSNLCPDPLLLISVVQVQELTLQRNECFENFGEEDLMGDSTASRSHWTVDINEVRFLLNFLRDFVYQTTETFLRNIIRDTIGKYRAHYNFSWINCTIFISPSLRGTYFSIIRSLCKTRSSLSIFRTSIVLIIQRGVEFLMGQLHYYN